MIVVVLIVIAAFAALLGLLWYKTKDNDSKAGNFSLLTLDDLPRSRPIYNAVPLSAPSDFESLVREMAKSHGATYIHAKVAGAKLPNEDGTSRQQLIQRCKPLDKLQLVHDEKNPLDKSATKVLNADDLQLGWLERDTAKQIKESRSTGTRWLAVVHEASMNKIGSAWELRIVLFRIDP